MRELKFRAYHFGAGYSVRPEMLYDENLGDVLKWKRDGQDLSEVMQYTGLKDKNGREIYEGDVVKRIETTGYTFVGEVVYEEYGFGIKPYGFFSPLSKKGKYDDGKSSFDYSVEYEIIGNRFENPELLGDSR